MNKPSLILPIFAVALWGCAASNGETASAEPMMRTSHLVLDAVPN